jgi:CheY-like chemotaxis protein
MSQRILVIEDQEDTRRILRDLLTGAGYEMIEAAEVPSPSREKARVRGSNWEGGSNE